MESVNQTGKGYKMITIHKTDRYMIQSAGSGAFFTVTRQSDQASVFLQGGDAIEFGSEIEACEKHSRPLDDLCADYDEVMNAEVQAIVDAHRHL
jgi:hypothetical protein